MKTSNDEPIAVQVEIAAAALTKRRMTSWALFGWMCHEDERDPIAWPPVIDDGVQWWAGWLAREISTNRGR